MTCSVCLFFSKAETIRSTSLAVYDRINSNARSLHRKFASDSGSRPKRTPFVDDEISLAWEAKKEVELLRETMESMFQMFGETLQDALKGSGKPNDESYPIKNEESKSEFGQPLKDFEVGAKLAEQTTSSSRALSTVHIIEL